MHSTDTMPDEEVILNRYYFNNTTGRTYSEILKDRVIVTEGKRGMRASI